MMQGQLDNEGRSAAATFTHGGNGTVMKFCEHSRNRQTETDTAKAMRAACSRVIALRKGVEDPLDFRRFETDARVGNFHCQCAALVRQLARDDDITAWWSELNGILEYVPKHLL